MTHAYTPSDATRVKRRPERGSYDRDLIHGILDEALLCHVAYAAGGHVFAIPMAFARSGETLYLHGARANRSLDALARGEPFSIGVTLLDGLVLARSGFHHSMNYRSAVVLGRAREVDDRDEKLRAMDLLLERLARGRSRVVRPPHDWEVDVTRMLAVEIEEASAKTRSGPPIDEIGDLAHPCWAGVVPLALVAGDPVAEPDLPGELEPPEIPAWLRAGLGARVAARDSAL